MTTVCLWVILCVCVCVLFWRQGLIFCSLGCPWTWSLDQAEPKLMVILLPQYSEYWDYNSELSPLLGLGFVGLVCIGVCRKHSITKLSRTVSAHQEAGSADKVAPSPTYCGLNHSCLTLFSKIAWPGMGWHPDLVGSPKVKPFCP